MDIQLERSYPTPLANSTLLPLLLLSLARQRYTPATSSVIDDEYDYIVVGGGAAGSVVAGRLSEMPSARVLLLEAGPPQPLLTEVPALHVYFLGCPDLDWLYKTVPQKHIGGALKDRVIGWSSGKMLGGSSSINGLAYVRGNRKCFDEWEQQGAKGWSYKDVFPYFLKLEDNRTPSFLENGYHAAGGPITVEQPRYNPALKQAVKEAATEMGYEFVDPNGESEAGFYDMQRNMRDNQRCSPVKGYLVPAENRTNLDILTNAFVTKVVIEGDTATGVEFYHNGQPRTVKCKKEVIVSAGTVNTPKILMLSGIGPREELEKFDIPVIADLPVGKNLQDHGAVLYPFTLSQNYSSYDEKLANDSNINQYIYNRTGPLTSAMSLTLAFLNGQSPASLTDFPDYAILFGEMSKRTLSRFTVKPEVFQKFIEPYLDQPVARCKSQHLRVKSKGTVTLNSSDPFDPPLIDPNYLEDPEDLEVIVEGLKMCKILLETEPFKKIGAKPFDALFPGCEEFAENEDEYLQCYAKAFMFNNYHSVGTAKMGDPSDPTTVVDPELRVKGIKGLRVVDASVMPGIPAANVNIPTIMIAEKASDMIKDAASCEDIFPESSLRETE